MIAAAVLVDAWLSTASYACCSLACCSLVGGVGAPESSAGPIAGSEVQDEMTNAEIANTAPSARRCVPHSVVRAAPRATRLTIALAKPHAWLKPRRVFHLGNGIGDDQPMPR